MNPSELNYQAVSTCETGRKMEEGKKYRQYMVGFIGEWIKKKKNFLIA